MLVGMSGIHELLYAVGNHTAPTMTRLAKSYNPFFFKRQFLASGSRFRCQKCPIGIFKSINMQSHKVGSPIMYLKLHQSLQKRDERLMMIITLE